MTFTEFISRYINTKVDYDGHYGPQCVDLFRQYCQDVVGCGHTGRVDGAKDLFHKYWDLPKEQEAFIRMSSIVTPVPGDVLIWDNMSYGHVAIVVVARGDQCMVFEQDGYKQDGAKLAVKNLNSVLGVLRPRKVIDL